MNATTVLCTVYMVYAMTPVQGLCVYFSLSKYSNCLNNCNDEFQLTANNTNSTTAEWILLSFSEHSRQSNMARDYNESRQTDEIGKL